MVLSKKYNMAVRSVKSRGRKSGPQQKLGMERIEMLFELAEKAFERHPERSHRNVQLARKIAMRYNIRMPQRLKRRFCKKCYKYLSPNMKSERGASHSLLITKCPACGSINRHLRKGVND